MYDHMLYIYIWNYVVYIYIYTREITCAHIFAILHCVPCAIQKNMTKLCKAPSSACSWIKWYVKNINQREKPLTTSLNIWGRQRHWTARIIVCMHLFPDAVHSFLICLLVVYDYMCRYMSVCKYGWVQQFNLCLFFCLSFYLSYHTHRNLPSQFGICCSFPPSCICSMYAFTCNSESCRFPSHNFQHVNSHFPGK